jgi:hypothetical protein
MPQLTDPERYGLADHRLLTMLHHEHWGAWLRGMVVPGLKITVVLDTEPIGGALARAWRHNGNQLPGLWAVDVPRLPLPVLVELVPMTTALRAPVQARRWGDISGAILYSSYSLVRDVVEALEARNGW